MACAIVSTIERPKQDAMQAAVKEERPEADDVHVGMASVKPGDGAIVALYGGEDYSKRQQNAATQDKMQAGSTFKIFTLIAALQSGDVSLKTRFDGASPQYFEEFADPNAETSNGRRGRVKNFGDESFGQIDLRRATGRSVNTVYAELNIHAGPEKSMKAAEDAGVRSKLEPNMANVLGTDYVTVIDMANAYATIAAQGVRAEPYIIKEIRFRDETVPTIKAERRPSRSSTRTSCPTSSTRCPSRSRAAPPATSARTSAARPPARPAPPRASARRGSTATSRSSRRPSASTAAARRARSSRWRTSRSDGNITGGTFPARIWTAYMEVALEGTEVEHFPEPADINKDADPPPPTTQRAAAPRRRAADDHERAPDDDRPAGAEPVEDEDERQPHTRTADPEPSKTLTAAPSLPRADRGTPMERGRPRVSRRCRAGPTTSVGGPAGRRLRRPERGPLAALAPVVLLLALPLSLAALRQAGCLTAGWAGGPRSGGSAARRSCSRRERRPRPRAHRLPLGVGPRSTSRCSPVPSPPARRPRARRGRWDSSAGSSPSGWCSRPPLLAGLVVAVGTIRRHPAADPVALALSPVLALTVLLSADLLPVALAVAAVWAWSRDRPRLAGVLAGLGVLGGCLLGRRPPRPRRSSPHPEGGTPPRRLLVAAGGTALAVVVVVLLARPRHADPPVCRVAGRRAPAPAPPGTCPRSPGIPVDPTPVALVALLGTALAAALVVLMARAPAAAGRRRGRARRARRRRSSPRRPSRRPPRSGCCPSSRSPGIGWRDHLLWAGAEAVHAVASTAHLAARPTPPRACHRGGTPSRCRCACSRWAGSPTRRGWPRVGRMPSRPVPLRSCPPSALWKTTEALSAALHTLLSRKDRDRHRPEEAG